MRIQKQGGVLTHMYASVSVKITEITGSREVNTNMWVFVTETSYVRKTN